jgi:hypothetical protein
VSLVVIRIAFESAIVLFNIASDLRAVRNQFANSRQ